MTSLSPTTMRMRNRISGAYSGVGEGDKDEDEDKDKDEGCSLARRME